jgi:putative hydrolase of the HAD superfamily
MSNRYRFLLFDFVNTLVLPDRSTLPVLVVDGKPVASTAPLLCGHLARHRSGLDPVAVHRAQREAWRWAEGRRAEEHREVPAVERFRRLAAVLDIPDVDEAGLMRLVELHMAAVIATFRFPAAHRALLEGLRRRYRMGILSNFDHGPPVRAVLAREGVLDWFDPIVISADIGYRKPGERAFGHALARTGEPQRDVLHVGDSFGDDVVGAQGAGIDVAWINPGREPAPPGAQATYVLESLAHLDRVLA